MNPDLGLVDRAAKEYPCEVGRVEKYISRIRSSCSLFV